MKREKEVNGHLYHFNGAWYNFCLKCSAPSNSRHKCEVNISLQKIKEIETIKEHYHDIDPISGLCKKCDVVFFETGTCKIINNAPHVFFLEEKSDRIINRYFTKKFNATGYIPLICKYSTDDAIMKDIIL